MLQSKRRAGRARARPTPNLARCYLLCPLPRTLGRSAPSSPSCPVWGSGCPSQRNTKFTFLLLLLLLLLFLDGRLNQHAKPTSENWNIIALYPGAVARACDVLYRFFTEIVFWPRSPFICLNWGCSLLLFTVFPPPCANQTSLRCAAERVAGGWD